MPEWLQNLEAPWFERRQQLNAWVLAECVEGRGAFHDAIVNALWSICEESTWSLPAHIPVAGLPDTAIPHVDLFAAETGCQLAWTHYLLAEALNGVETYSRKTFGADRYSIWTMQSQYHNLPIVNGIQQQAGREFQARALTYRADARIAEFLLDIAGAYPAAAGWRACSRTLRLERNSKVVLRDEMECDRAPHSLEWTFLTPCLPRPTARGIRLDPRPLPNAQSSGVARLIFDGARLTARVETLPIRDPRLKTIWGDRLFRLRIRARKPRAQDAFAFEISGP